MRTPNGQQTQAEFDPSEYLTEEQIAEGEKATFSHRTGIKTITAKNVNAHPERAKLHERVIVCMRIYGTILNTAQVEAEPGKKDTEILTVLTGDFKADSYNDYGEIASYAAGWCAPPIGLEALVKRLLQAQHDHQANGGTGPIGVEFDYEYASIPAGNLAGYKWGAKDLLPVNDSFRIDEAMAIYRRRLAYGGELPQLAAPNPAG